jgi:hypothetical protein
VQHGLELSQLPLGHVLVTQSKTQLPQHIVKPPAGVGVLFQQVGQACNRVAAVKAQRHTLGLQTVAMAQAKQKRHQGVDVIHINGFETSQPRCGQHPTGAATDQDQMGLRGLHLR